MPSKRATKAKANRSKPKLKEDGEGEDGLSASEREAKMKSYVKDFDITLQIKEKTYDSELQKLIMKADMSFRHLCTRLSEDERKMTVEEYIKVIEEEEEAEERDTFDENNRLQRSTMVLNNNHKPTLSDTVSKYMHRSRQAIETIMEEGAVTTTVKKTKRGRKKATGVTFNAEPPPVQSCFITPAMIKHNTALGWNTPLVTPKFDPRLPVTPAQRRDARPGETVMSLAGSPVNVLSRQTVVVNKNAKALNVALPEGFDASEEKIQKIMSTLEQILQGENNT